MDLILLILATARAPMLASQIAPLLSKDANAVRATLALLHKEGLASKRLVGSKGPSGTYDWTATETGRACVAELQAWIKAQQS